MIPATAFHNGKSIQLWSSAPGRLLCTQICTNKMKTFSTCCVYFSSQVFCYLFIWYNPSLLISNKNSIICTDLGGWVGLRKLDVRILVPQIICTPRNPIIIVRRMDFLGHECSDLGVGGWVSRNPNIFRICKSVQIIGQSLNE